jgi:hypothetical protein
MAEWVDGGGPEIRWESCVDLLGEWACHAPFARIQRTF